MNYSKKRPLQTETVVSHPGHEVDDEAPVMQQLFGQQLGEAAGHPHVPPRPQFEAGGLQSFLVLHHAMVREELHACKAAPHAVPEDLLEVSRGEIALTMPVAQQLTEQSQAGPLAVFAWGQDVHGMNDAVLIPQPSVEL